MRDAGSAAQRGSGAACLLLDAQAWEFCRQHAATAGSWHPEFTLGVQDEVVAGLGLVHVDACVISQAEGSRVLLTAGQGRAASQPGLLACIQRKRPASNVRQLASYRRRGQRSAKTAPCTLGTSYATSRTLP